MTTTNLAKSGTALLIYQYGPNYAAIGTGSMSDLATIGSLVTEVQSTRKYWSEKTSGTVNQIGYRFDYNSIEMSGTNLKEFGLALGSVVGVQDLWIKKGIPATLFDGSNELIIEFTFRTF